MSANGTKLTKKQMERSLLDAFRTCCADFPSGTIEETEEPDFLVRGASGTLGIELTQLFLPSVGNIRPLREQEVLRRRVVDAAHALGIRQSLPPLCVRVYFNSMTELAKADIVPLAERLVDMVTTYLPASGAIVELDADRLELDSFPDDHVSGLIVFRPEQAQQSDWFDPNAAFIPSCGPEMFQPLIDRKNQLYPAYRRKCDSAWLVIVADGLEQSSSLDVAASVLIHRFGFAFERSYLFQRFAGQVFRLSS